MSYSPTTSEQIFATIVEKLLNNPGVTSPSEGKKFGSSGLKMHNKIFVMLAGGKLVLKLPKTQVDALVTSGAGERFDPRRDGRLMKEWVVVEAMSEEESLSLAREAMNFVASQR